jgi:tetratricopeptide (TPR) repeat protein
VPAANGVPAHLLAIDVHRAEGDAPTLATLAAAFGRHHQRDLAAIYRDMNKRAPAFKPEERALISWAEKFLDADRPREAVEIMLLTTGLYPDSGRARFYLAMAYDKNRDSAPAIEAYRRVLVIWPGMADAQQAIERLQLHPKK